ncbi:YtxH domain-containing protein [Candidatus Saccharibacteria bacterium]|jgi:gas vesicle protein|nr:MAG: YtxH domain-containing protein [Candidatus Saccharibacteria bacterium]
MSENNKSNGAKVAVGAVLGVVGGFVAGLLFAPKSGKETRADIKQAAEKLIDKVQKEAEDIFAQAKKVESTLEEKAKAELVRLKHKAEEARDKVKAAASKAADKKDDAALQAALDDAHSAFSNLKAFVKNVAKKK